MKSFHCFSALCVKFSVYANWVDTVFGDAVVDKIWVTLGEGEELRVLGIGSGSGKYTKRTDNYDTYIKDLTSYVLFD